MRRRSRLGAALLVLAVGACSGKPEEMILGTWVGDMASGYWSSSGTTRVEGVTVEFREDRTAALRTTARFNWPSEVRDTVETPLTWTIEDGTRLRAEDVATHDSYTQSIVTLTHSTLVIEGDGPLRGRFRRAQ